MWARMLVALGALVGSKVPYARASGVWGIVEICKGKSIAGSVNASKIMPLCYMKLPDLAKSCTHRYAIYQIPPPVQMKYIKNGKKSSSKQSCR